MSPDPIQPLRLACCIASASLILPSCQTGGQAGAGDVPGPGISLEEETSHSFLEICRELRQSNGFRQNVCLCARQDGWAQICMDRQRRLYLVIPTDSQKPLDAGSPGSLRNLRIAPDELRRRLDPESFVLGSPGEPFKPAIAYRIPEGAPESFGVDVLNHHFRLNLKPAEQRFQWD